MEIEVLCKGLGFSPTPSFINEADLKRDFADFSRKMRCKWHFRNDISENFSETPAFRTKSTWNPPQGHPALEMFLSQMEADVFSLLPGNTTQYNLSKEEWLAMRRLAEDRSIVIKPADKGSCVVVWDRTDYLLEAEKHLSDSSTYKEVKFGDKELLKLVEESNKMFKRLLSKKCILPEESKYFSYNFKKVTNLGKLYFLPKIHKRLYNVPGRPVISNWYTYRKSVGILGLPA